MRQFAGILCAVLLSISLAGCFTAKSPLIGADEAEFPYDRIVFVAIDRPEDRLILQRDGDTYLFRPSDEDERYARLRLKGFGEGFYVAQLQAPPGEDDPGPLYAVLAVSADGRRIASHAAIRPDDFEAVPGLSLCDTSVCIDDLGAYVAYARARILAGAAPDAEYRILEAE
ncbi:MAG: hypothetical protein KDK07_14235 [Bauldia sp.]|nr:hypothetical protein [Bauldia sp.]